MLTRVPVAGAAAQLAPGRYTSLLAVLVILSVAVAPTAPAGSLASGDAVALDRVALAVDGAESSHGANPAMWRPDLDGPQGPMQVSAAAAADVGGGNRFDFDENRMIGRAYLAHLYRRYANWPDAVAAYNWGPGRMDAWIGAGRPIDKFPLAVSLYRYRVLLGDAAAWAATGAAGSRRFAVHLQARRSLADRRHPSRESVAVEQLYGPIIAESERALR